MLVRGSHRAQLARRVDSVDLGESLKTYGLHVKMTHDDPRLYLISHASLEKRGLSIGQANVYQMLAPEHRLHIPLSLLQPLVDANGKDLPKLPSASESIRPPTLQEIVDHLTALTTDSIPLFLGGGSSFNDGTTQTVLDPPEGGAGSHP
jgi:hypothetical protein